MADTIEQIKSRLDVVAVLSEYLKVQKSGINYKARCPFHNEKTPSFYISPERQIWHCFGCSMGGDIFGFIKAIEGVEFPEALRILAKKAGVQVDNYDPSVKDDRKILYEIAELTTKFFEKQLQQSSSGQAASAYLRERGLSDESIKSFRLGFAPNDWHALGKFLRDCGYQDKDIVAAGVAINNNGRQYDRFRSRIIFPISDLNDQVVGFTARIFQGESEKGQGLSEEGAFSAKASEGQAKYINTPQTAIYDKSRVLYGFNKAKLQVRQAARCLLVEGNMDAIMSYQAGVQNVVATSGTALTATHLGLLKRYTENLDFCFDTDQAGALATRRGIGLALGQGFAIKVVSITDPECKDPADFVKKYDSKWIEAVQKSQPVIEFYFEKTRVDYQGTPEQKKMIINTLAPLIKRLTSQVEQSHWVSQLASYMRTAAEAVQKDIAVAKDDLSGYEHSVVATPVAVRQNIEAVAVPADKVGETILSIILKNPLLFRDDASIDLSYIESPIREIIADVAKLDPQNFNIDSFIKQHGGTQAMALEFSYLKSQELWKDFSDDELRSEFSQLIKKIKQRKIVERLGQLELDMKSAESVNDTDKITQLAATFSQLARELATIYNA